MSDITITMTLERRNAMTLRDPATGNEYYFDPDVSKSITLPATFAEQLIATSSGAWVRAEPTPPARKRSSSSSEE